MIPIPYALEHGCTVRGAGLKTVTCEKCNSEYGYQVVCKASGSDTDYLFLNSNRARRNAEAIAKANLRDSIARATLVVPCPSCGQIQRGMLQVARNDYRRWMYVAGMIMMILSCAIAPLCITYDWLIVQYLALFSFSFGILLVATRKFLAARYDPNATDYTQRIAWATAMAIPPEVLSTIQSNTQTSQAEKEDAMPLEENPFSFEAPGAVARRRASHLGENHDD